MKNEFEVTKKLYHSWAGENRRKKSRRLIFAGWCIMIVLLAGMTAFFAVVQKDFLFGKFFLCFVLMIIYCIYRAFFHNYVLTEKQYQAHSKMLGGKNWTRTIEFKEEEIVTAEGNVTVKTPYSEISRMECDDTGIIRLYTKKNMVIRLYKDKFTVGNFEKFKVFINDKIGV